MSYADINNKTVDDSAIKWECPFTGTLYDYKDTRLAGYGNPPTSPHTPDGYGREPMILKRVSTATETPQQ